MRSWDVFQIKLKKLPYIYLDTPKSGLELEYYNRIGTLAFKCTGWPSGSGIICSTSYLRSITRKLALGAELTLRSSALPELNQRLSDITYYARFVLQRIF